MRCSGPEGFAAPEDINTAVDLDRDYPALLQKPVDTPYGPYADGFSEQQHKYGPFAPIRAATNHRTRYLLA
jgi:cytochrome c